MESIKINRKDRILAISELDTILMLEEPERLLIVFSNNINYKISIGQYLAFRRYDYGEDEFIRTMTDLVEVLEKTEYDGHDAVYTTIPGKPYLKPLMRLSHKLNIKRTSEDCLNDYDAYFDDFNRYLMVKVGDTFEINDWLYYYNEVGNERFVVQFKENHNIFPQDIYITNEYLKEDYTMTVKSDNGNVIGTIGGVTIPIKGVHRVAESGDTLTEYGIDTCGKIDGLVRLFKYTHTPDTFSRNSIMFSKASTTQTSGDFFDLGCWLIVHGGLFEPKFNPYYYYEMEGSSKICRLWYDCWWNEFDVKNGHRPLREMYVNSGNSRTIFGEDGAYWRVPTLALSSDEYSMGIEDDQNNRYVNDIIDRTIPDVIDTERFKYVPIIIGHSKNTMVKSIIFDLHFRKRTVKREYPSKLTETGAYYEYDDGWYIDDLSGTTVWWNGMDYNGYGFNSSNFTTFYNESGKTSDLLGYLGFSDDDVRYRKSKLAMSFIRISFYTSKDPIEQKLLYYSTIFLDSTNLHGKCIKQSLYKHGLYGDNESTPLVFFPDNSVSARIDTELCVKSEIDTMASSEGFNLYLFGDDAEKTDEGKPYRTIYMKVEFNHAGNGKTIPMIMWPKDGNGNFRDVTSNTFINDLYIPVQVGYIDDKFVYSLPTVDNEDGNLRLILFEPKLGYTEFGDVANVSSDGQTIRTGYNGWSDGGGVVKTERPCKTIEEEDETDVDYEYDTTISYDVPEVIDDDTITPIDGGGQEGGEGSGVYNTYKWGNITTVPKRAARPATEELGRAILVRSGETVVMNVNLSPSYRSKYIVKWGKVNQGAGISHGNPELGSTSAVLKANRKQPSHFLLSLIDPSTDEVFWAETISLAYDDTPISNGGSSGGNSGGGQQGGPVVNFPSKSDKRLYFGAYSVNTFYGKRLSLPVFLRYPSGRPTSSNYEAVYSINRKLKITSSNPSVIDIPKDNYTAVVWLYNACDRYTLPAVVHIDSKRIKGVGSAVIKVELVDNPDVYDTCIVNVSNTNNEGAASSSFANRNLVYPWETYVRKDAFFDIWMHHYNFNKYQVSISDDSAITRENNGGGLEDSLNLTLKESTHTMAFKALQAGDYTITFEHPDYSGTGKAKVHIIDE